MTAGIPTIATSRLILRPLEISDAGAMQDLFPQWEIVQFLASDIPWPYPDDGALAYIRDVALPAIRHGTEWHWSLRRKVAPERLVGVISLMDSPRNNRGFWLDPRLQGQGLMSEANTAVTDYWFETLERPVLRVPKAVANVRSRRISERSGMRVIEIEDQDYISGRRLPTEIWEITREEWHNRSR
jgi:ribosomal-protein-alanine N-acetyltransferase